MKHLIFLYIWFLFSISICAQDATYYWYDGERKYLEYVPEKEFVLVGDIETKKNLEVLLSNQGANKVLEIGTKTFHNTLTDSSNTKYNWAVIENLNPSQSSVDTLKKDLYWAPFLRSTKGQIFGLTNLFYVKLKSEGDFSILRSFALEKGITILKQNKYIPNWYTLSCSKESEGNSLDMANRFYESGLFAASEPSFMYEDLTHSVDDEYFDDQWALDNTGQYGIGSGWDIAIRDAWDITFGDTCITVAVIDQGIESNHPDFGNISALSYDAQSESPPSTIYSWHGMSVSGIISAGTDNSIGVAGIAPGTQLMPISHSLSYRLDIKSELADAISWAAENGADVISNSWGDDALESTLIDDAIEDALNEGRDGLGCVVVFSAGNENTDVAYPANSNPDIVAVGAMDPDGYRKSLTTIDSEWKWGSNYSDELDMIAPGVLISTLDRQGDNGFNPDTALHILAGGTMLSSDYVDDDYTIWFNGTSAAAPHVSAVAALILSANSGLTQEEVCNILFTTAWKLARYTFTADESRPSTWNSEVGYGSLLAHSALVEAVCENTIENTIYTSDITISDCSSVTMEDVIITAGAKLTISNAIITIDGPFEAEIGTQLVFDP